MCGICGFAGTHNPELLRRMATSIFHRGPDGEGLFEDGERVGLGMRRLAIIDIAGGNQPIYNEDKTLAVVFNGEIYNYRELRDRLISKGHRFSTNSDTETIVHAYEEYGDSCSSHFRGMFAFAIWDTRNKRLFIGRDHFGIKPLYYAELGGQLYFGSEIKCLLQHAPLNTGMDYNALDNYFSLTYIPEPLSAFKGVRKLPPAHNLIWQNGKITIKSYWSVPAYSPGPRLSDKEHAAAVTQMLINSLAEQKVADVPLGVFLSGGLDSSAIVAFLFQQLKIPVKSFSIGYQSADMSYDETAKARLIARYFGCEHHEHIVNPNACEILPLLAAHFDEPFADSSAIPTYLVSREARKHITVALTGIGGDEIFAGYPRYMGAQLSQDYARLPLFLRRGIASASRLVPETRASRNIGGWIRRFAAGGTMPFSQRYAFWVTFLHEKDKQALYTPQFSEQCAGNDYLSSAFVSGLNDPDDLFKHDINTYLSDDLLCLADRSSMAASLELRVPFLDVRLVEYMSRISLADKTHGRRLKNLLKIALSDVLPQSILQQKKQGFQIPIGRWINTDLKDMVDDLLSPAMLARDGFFNSSAVMKMLSDHRSGYRNFTDQIYSLVMFQLWQINMKKLYASSGRTSPAETYTCATNKISLDAQLNTNPRNNILLINIAGIGDFLESQKSIAAIRESYPSAHITLLVSTKVAEYAAACKLADEIRVFPVRHGRGHGRLFSRETLKLIKLIGILKERRYNTAINFSEISTWAGALRMYILLLVLGIKETYGRNTNGRGFFMKYAIPDMPDDNHGQHWYFAKLVELFTGRQSLREHKTCITATDTGSVGTFLKRHNVDASARLLIISPGSDRLTRRWQADRFAKAADSIAVKHDLTTIIVGSANERQTAEEVRSAMKTTSINGAGEFSISGTLALIAGAKLVICTNSALMHMAGIMSVPFVAIAGSGDIPRDTPDGDENHMRLLKIPIPCSPCYNYSCRRLKTNECMQMITVEQVIAACEEVLRS